MSHDIYIFSMFARTQIIAGPNLRGWFDATDEKSNWMKNISSTEDSKSVNVQQIFINGHVSPPRRLNLFAA